MADNRENVPYFTRAFFTSGESFSRVGNGELGGKARGLLFAKRAIDSNIRVEEFPSVDIVIPTSVVLTTEVFESFMTRNNLGDVASSDVADERINHAFQKADLPVEFVGDLRALIEQVHSPLAVRSSSLLEDAMFRPFAGVYQTKMIPNNQPDPDARFRKLVEAIKFVYASTYSKGAKGYRRAAGKSVGGEKMAVIVQEVIGNR